MLHSLCLLAALLPAAPKAAHPVSPHSRTGPPAATAPSAIPAARAADSYAIYALLLPGAPGDKIAPSTSMHWVVADTTVNITDMNPAVPPNGELKPPPDNRRGFEEALGDFQARKFLRYRLLSTSFHGGEHSLVNVHQTRNLRSSASGSTGVTYFSAVYFNNKRTAALVYVNDWCANLCSAGQWVYLEKHGGNWVRRSGLVSGGG
jgi:hypothetical protein